MNTEELTLINELLTAEVLRLRTVNQSLSDRLKSQSRVVQKNGGMEYPPARSMCGACVKARIFARGWNIGEAAKELGIPRGYLQNELKYSRFSEPEGERLELFKQIDALPIKDYLIVNEWENTCR